MRSKLNQKEAKRHKHYSKNTFWSVGHFIFVTLSIFIEVVRNGHCTLVGLTMVKGTSAHQFFLVLIRDGSSGFWYLWVLPP